MLFDRMTEKMIFMFMAICACYLSFEHLFLESQLTSKTDFGGWGDFLGEISDKSNSNTLIIYCAIFLLAFVSLILTMKNIFKKKKIQQNFNN